jgi:hypothetical protein
VKHGPSLRLYRHPQRTRDRHVHLCPNNPKATVNLTGVKADLIGIAGAERRYYATEGKYASLDELISANYIAIARQRPPYTYEIQTSNAGFHVVATRSADDASGVPAQLSVDDNMEFQSSE